MRKYLLLLLCLLLIVVAIASLSQKPDKPEAVAPQLTQETLTDSYLQQLGFNGLAGQDLRNLDFTDISYQLAWLNFDTATEWPDADKLHPLFDPALSLEHGKNPGLGVKSLHASGITGQGISIAIVDKPLLLEHIEWAGRMEYIEVQPNSPIIKRTHFHGSAAASILAGQSVGVAPDAFIYYFAVPDDMKNIEHYTLALHMIIELNQTLEPTERIRVVSISDGCPPELQNAPVGLAWYDAIAQAEVAGIHVVACDRSYPLWICVASCPAELDPDNPENYAMGAWWQKHTPAEAMGGWTDMLLLPGDFRTYASTAGEDIYHYCGIGGTSWVAPYLAGLYALGWQVSPEAAIEELQQGVLATAYRTSFGPLLVNPTGFIEYLQGK